MVLIAGLVALAAAPQGVTISVRALELQGGATTAQALLVTTAVSAELSGQGYALLDEPGKAQALVVGRLEKKGAGFVVRLMLTKGLHGQALDDVTITVGKAEELPGAGTQAARQLATELRIAFGVRARLKQ